MCLGFPRHPWRQSRNLLAETRHHALTVIQGCLRASWIVSRFLNEDQKTVMIHEKLRAAVSILTLLRPAFCTQLKLEAQKQSLG